MLKFLKNGAKTDVEIANATGLDYSVLGKARNLGLIEHHGYLIWLTSSGENKIEKFDADKAAKDHKQFEKWIRGETDEPPECMKIKDTDVLPEVTPEQERAIEPFKKAGLLGLAWKQEAKKKKKPEPVEDKFDVEGHIDRALQK